MLHDPVDQALYCILGPRICNTDCSVKCLRGMLHSLTHADANIKLARAIARILTAPCRLKASSLDSILCEWLSGSLLAGVMSLSHSSMLEMACINYITQDYSMCLASSDVFIETVNVIRSGTHRKADTCPEYS